MEIRARFVLVGVFVVAVIVAAFGFVFWLNNTGGIGPRTAYRVEFSSAVSGLWPGSDVLFNGIKVGEVTGLDLVTDDPGKVVAEIAIDSRTPVKSDTHVGLVFSGLTGTAAIALTGGTPSAAAPQSSNGAPPVLVADAEAVKDLTQSARDTLNTVDNLIADNSANVTDAIANIDKFAAALGSNSDKVGDVLEGLAKLTGGGKQANQVAYQLTPPAAPAGATPPDVSLGIAEPTAILTLDAQTIMTEQNGGLVSATTDAKWADNMPLLVRAALLTGFQNAKYLKVGADGGDFEADDKLAIDVQKFSFGGAAGAMTANVALSAKLLDSDGKLLDSHLFSADAPVASPGDVPAAVAALNQAFGEAGSDLIGWTMTTLAADATPAPEDKTAPGDTGGDKTAPADSAAPADNPPPADNSAPAGSAAPDAGGSAAPAPDTSSGGQ
ncbi:MAG TPA: ABC-type transport auxiliary lipoprotein family protein [Bauldia sp.]|nr:ABC-type transport auxiliary lipoprotein family protein [Bauldia sp.]